MSLHNSCFDEPNHEYLHDSDLELGGKITLLAGQINAATYLFLKMLAEFDRRKGWESRYKKRMLGAFWCDKKSPAKWSQGLGCRKKRCFSYFRFPGFWLYS